MDYIYGPRFYWILASLSLALLFSSLESTIVSTALLSIASDLGNYSQSNWIIVSYLLIYSSFLIIYARLSDTFGRKSGLLTGLGFFTIASLACGLARTLEQLIIFRAFQGLGGAGIYAMTMVIIADITPPERFGVVSGLLGVVFALASALGPVIGGAITSNSTWRWCFWLNVPPGSLIAGLLAFILPGRQCSEKSLRESLWNIDWLGCVLALAASITTVIPLEEGGNGLAWNSVPTVALFVMGGSCWIAFAAWESWLAFQTKQCSSVLPVLPVRIMLNRVIPSCILTAMLTGISFTAVIVYLPQRFQVVDYLSPVQAGVRMLPLIVVSALATTIAGAMLGKKNICQYLVIGGNVLQVVGLGLLSSIHGTAMMSTQKAQYGYQVILGTGFGMTLSSCVVLARVESDRKDIAPLMGAITQLRVFGGVLGVAICRIVLFSHVNSELPQVAVQKVFSSVAEIDDLEPEQVAMVRRVYGKGFSLQTRILMYVAAVNIVVSLFTSRMQPKQITPSSTGDGNSVELGEVQD